MTESESGPKIDLYVRSLCPTGARQRQERVIERLSAMEEEDRLAEYRGDDLRYVAPCVDDGTVCTIPDRLDVLEGGPRWR